MHPPLLFLGNSDGGSVSAAFFDANTGKVNAASGTFAPATKASKPPLSHDAKCGAACHEMAASKDYIFTAYLKR